MDPELEYERGNIYDIKWTYSEWNCVTSSDVYFSTDYYVELPRDCNKKRRRFNFDLEPKFKRVPAWA